ncbi:2-C-methyl-D-erythritol 2,4-cyclodiphosphate synthase [Candidatus Magnetominusculus xianensis]|uniref:2-C-methyl-D-erythritol 2,4-cyclodiphosphate synthase n=1 Tax=Candidatus Magnetominusculus xianensis TaxID=1748249 RepID=A0ABR5SGJ0_9BACT|nr:2-C-methyl-D-erythritol 2,4-cyclodiphosphate synthase [Candidatus Magnetominusculus xianensis]KWT85915.1 2-C-methyl-D-erythritol 2,4-cyclodiphosphate synthase [Candidatus Magnetominusculus xianensis]MBF0403588.1 2-C-methyl-D-erythritol 2,4-cyclodiphosphate synthase [Nitrospirota bacterium]
MRTGIGYDSHRLTEGRRLIIGGVEIPFEGKGLAGHSDADCLVHSIIDALLGAAGLGDIGMMFPDTEAQWKDANSIELLRAVVRRISECGLEVTWLDCVVIAERPRLRPYIDSMKQAIAASGIGAGLINIKAKTNETMGFIGRGEGIAAIATCLLQKQGLKT